MDGAVVDFGELVSRGDLELSVPGERVQEPLGIGGSAVNDQPDSGDQSSSEDSLNPDSDADGTEASHMHSNRMELTTVSEEVIHRCADAMSRMEPTRPDIVRATRAFQALKRLGAPLRGVEVKGGFFSLSKPASSMQFWSHSWHGSKWAKITTLFVLQNAAAAALIGTMPAFCATLFLGLSQASHLEALISTLAAFAVPSCFVIGLVTQGLVLAFWRRHELVFLDRLCISDDPAPKLEGLFSMGAILKSSNSMLVLWDTTYQSRLWCVFEVAAFLRSRPQNQKPHFIIRPTILGPVMAAAGFALTLACGGAYLAVSLAATTIDNLSQGLWWWPFWLIIGAIAGMIFLKIADVVRAYCREVENLSDQLRDFRFDDAVAYCCSVRHIDPDTGSPIVCDREIVRQCIVNWFGSVGEFEATVRTEVLDILYTHLSTAMLSYRRVVEASPVVVWVFFDFAQVPMRKSIDLGMWALIRGFTYWLSVIPTLFVVMYRLAHLTRRKRSSRCLDKLVSVLLVCVGIGFFMAVTTLEGILVILLNAWVPVSAFGTMFFLINMGLTALAFRRV